MSKYADKRMFGGNREKTILRDGEKCLHCGMTRAEHRIRYRRDITVDHIDGRGMNSPKEEKNNDMSNLQTLCIACHASKDNKQRKLTVVQAINIRHIKGEMSYQKIADLYGVSQPYISMVMNNQWRKV